MPLKTQRPNVEKEVTLWTCQILEAPDAHNQKYIVQILILSDNALFEFIRLTMLVRE